MFNDFRTPLLVGILCVPFLAGLALATLFGRVIAMIHSKLPMSAQGLLVHLLTIAVLLGLTAIIITRTERLRTEERFLGLGTGAWRVWTIILFAVGLLLGLSSVFAG